MNKGDALKVQRSVTGYDVARAAGVSRSTVSVVLNNIENVAISEKTRQRVLQVAASLQYRPNVAARSVIMRKACAFGVVSCWEPDSPLFARPVKGMLAKLKSVGYGLTLCDLETQNVEEGIDVAIGYWRESRIDGLIGLMKTTDLFPSQMAEKLAKARLPYVLINANMAQTVAEVVSSDNFQAGFLATEHLLKLGHRRVAFLLRGAGARQPQSSEEERYRGYAAAMQVAGISSTDTLVVHYVSGQLSIDTGYHAFKDYLQTALVRPTAVYAINDYLAIGAMYAAQDVGMAIPADLAIVGTDDYYIANQVRPSLTTVAQPLKELGEEAANILLARLAGKEPVKPGRIALPCRLVVRESCGASE